MALVRKANYIDLIGETIDDFPSMDITIDVDKIKEDLENKNIDDDEKENDLNDNDSDEN